LNKSALFRPAPYLAYFDTTKVFCFGGRPFRLIKILIRHLLPAEETLSTLPLLEEANCEALDWQEAA